MSLTRGLVCGTLSGSVASHAFIGSCPVRSMLPRMPRTGMGMGVGGGGESSSRACFTALVFHVSAIVNANIEQQPTCATPHGRLEYSLAMAHNADHGFAWP